MMVHARQTRRLVQLLAVFASLHQVVTATQYHASTSSSSSSKDAVPLTLGVASTQPSTSTALLDRIGRLLSTIFPSEDVESEGDGGFFGGDGSTLAWGGSTLEVVKTQATYLTRGAAFGPRITSEDGLKGGLLPISDFYHPYDHQSILDDNFGCPYKDGPGWRDEDFEEGDEDQGFQPAERMVINEKVKPPRNWIALIERGGNCSFASKVRVAQALGANAAVVGGGRGDTGLRARLVTMYAPGDISDIHIPSTFIARPSYEDLLRLINEIGQDNQEGCIVGDKNEPGCETRRNGLEVILGRDDIMWEWPLLDLAFILLLLPSFMTLTTIIVHRIRLARQRRRERAPEVVVLGLPCLIWRPDGQPWEKVEGSEDGLTSIDVKAPTKLNDTSDMELGNTQAEGEEASQAGPSTTPLRTVPVLPPAPVKQHAYLPPGRTYYSCDECAICLSEFADGDRVRVLPCGHVFHLSEIDSWLLRIKKLCPICKRDITVPIPPTPPAPPLHTAATSPQLSADTGNDEALIPIDESGDEITPTETTALLPRSA